MTNAINIGEQFGLHGKHAIVTGAATGIGREIAKLYDAAGAKVLAADINDKDLATLEKECEHVTPFIFDQGDPDSISALFSKADEAGDIDVLVNCAAIYPFRKFEEADTALLDKMYAIDVRGPFQCVQQAVKRMKRDNRGGSIVNISSVNSMKACIFDNVHYGISKAAINNLTVSVALEYAPHNIRVNAVLPGAIATEHAIKAGTEYQPKGPFSQPGRIPLSSQPTGPMSIANACLFLASDASGYITGQLLAVDGGFLIS